MPDPLINTCNGFYCDYFSPNKAYKPKMWTEAWIGWFTEFRGPVPHRPAKDLAFSVARFIQKEGSFINYYMYHGGTNFGRTAGGPFIATSYDYDAPLDEYGLLRQPKWGHLKDLHRAVKLCEPALVSGDPTVTKIGNYQENVGPHFETWNAGVLGPISLSGLNEGRRDLSWQKWSYKVGLKGEILSLHSLSGSSSVEWIQGSLVSQRQPLTWYKTTFDAPAGTAPLALDMDSMGKGQVWLNGQNLGRYWPAYKASGTCDYCDYAGTYNENKCRSNCGEASQRWYHVPQSWLKPTGNLLVVFEELGGDPNGIFLVRRDIDSVCADIYEWQPNLISYQMQTSGKAPVRPKVHLSCSPGQKISSIKFASFGTPAGSCGNFHEGSCHAHKSYDAFERNCVGQNWCTVTVSPENFGGDPCPNVLKKLSVEAICS